MLFRRFPSVDYVELVHENQAKLGFFPQFFPVINERKRETNNKVTDQRPGNEANH